ncbi:MAG TPA: PAS domain-containing methyl-accepting chemotaxis protein [Marinospirillum sp.]|uniref:methyl-accepting chemotaxis protein n=1 Tax=Marinospirillum sp. TaxID=2183934 RepID=UPI002B4622FA|nr:PAS domain-containing methyl-accepting chemotaxis protein [Marinospirillum sp.]HKM15600.1 PAS domain-containing methyl-accepting chemotaxis protein [Marinospirillum sp.]
MQINQPVTGKEQSVDANIQLITITDLSGKITFANDDFVNVSGYKRSELIGQNHNLIRHPDMPAGAFENLWKTIQNKQSWKGLVKNRCKNGDHYWVDAYVTPIQRDGKIVEYQSVRTTAPIAAVERANKVYTSWQQGKLPYFLQKKPLSLTTKLILAGLLPTSLISIALFMLNLSWLAVLAPLIAGLATTIFTHSQLCGLKQLETAACKINQNRVMTYLYTGRQDELGNISFALRTRSSELRAVVARLFNNSGYLRRSKLRSDECLSEAFEYIERQGSRIAEIQQAMQAQLHSLEQVMGSTQRTATAASQSQVATQMGQQKIEEVAQAIARQSIELEAAKQQVANLAMNSEHISTVIDVITNVAEQTNLLALNAAIEAARAGEAGRGFAVVADEVRGLAQRTHDSTLQVRTIIEQLKENTLASVQAIDKGVNASQETVELAKTMSHSLQEILLAVAEINNLATEVASMTNHQSVLSEQTRRQVTELSELAQHSVTAGNAATKQSNKLDMQVGNLHLLAANFIFSLNAEKA